ncbi:hypothetical protein TBLA_0A10380 [Henningerozyma blattae CBS 6284]|uniref:Transcription elongation factor 1 homolog n=1 Tax=Henningerozyma blattae (strain ATCC 34711 / CBS 6284 / DSM 70876 / NBRC 10599 / NRRL Y-10934 / UCD 77-7) TaxID=1071380 RepID=I2GXG4_HENB6|nr:hypothetical protein TBLA_0A10380 [Tetrapisispora blattae CBS 6284]CCH58816.1 hypothetical protein TBLA_0A10380 [Tetrapisispora blattae CBS 6284]
MGKRKKSSRGPAKKVVLKLDTKFNCLFCNHEKSVSCVLDKKMNLGSLNCKICGQSFQTRINALSQPVDIYSDWFDAVEEVNAGRASDSDGRDSDDGSSSDYESDSDDEPTRGINGKAPVDSDEDEVDSDEEQIGSHKRRGAVVDSDDE